MSQGGVELNTWVSQARYPMEVGVNEQEIAWKVLVHVSL